MKYSLEEIRDNLIKLKTKLKESGKKDGFYVIATRKDFKAIKLETTTGKKTTTEILHGLKNIQKYLLDGKENYFKGKKIAFINLTTNESFYNSPEYTSSPYDKIKNKQMFSLIIVVYIINDEGKINKEDYNRWRCRINFTLDDLSSYHFKLKDAEIIMRQVAANLMRTNNFSGVYFKDYMRIVNEKLKK